MNLKSKKRFNSNQIDNHKHALNRNQEDTQNRRLEISSLKDRVKEMEQEEDSKKVFLESLEKAEEQRRSDLQNTEKELDELTKKMSKVNRQLDAKRNEYKLTKSMIENLEGFPESIRFLSQSKEWNQDAPLLSDLIYVKEEYRVAIENYLEPYLNFYVVANLEEAYAAIKLLTRNSKGESQFLFVRCFCGLCSSNGFISGDNQSD